MKEFFQKGIFRALAALVIAVLLAFAAGSLFFGGIDAARTRSLVRSEAESVRERIDARADRLEERLGRLEERLDRHDRAVNGRLDDQRLRLESVDMKLDRILRLAEPPLPDGMKRAD